MDVVRHLTTWPAKTAVFHTIAARHLWHPHSAGVHDIPLKQTAQFPDVLLHVGVPVIDVLVYNNCRHTVLIVAIPPIPAPHC